MSLSIPFVRLPKLNLPKPEVPKGVWDGGGLGGAIVPAVPRELAFARWCRKNGHLCIRTVDLFWYLNYHSRAFPTFNAKVLKTVWQHQARMYAALSKSKLLMDAGKGWRKMTICEAKRWIRSWHPHPGRWDFYCQRRKHYFAKNRLLHRSIQEVWRQYPLAPKRAVLRCRRFSERMPEAYPDYYVTFLDSQREFLTHCFVEVKGFRESVRPSQKLFFPKLVAENSQRIWIVRLAPRGKEMRWYQFGPDGPKRMPTSPVGEPRRQGS